MPAFANIAAALYKSCWHNSLHGVLKKIPACGLAREHGATAMRAQQPVQDQENNNGRNATTT
jgi:hypothetical protein